MSDLTDDSLLTARERLLQAARGRLVSTGVGHSSLRQIAASIGTSHRMLIYHFGSREGLLAAIVDQLENEERLLLEAMTSKEGRSPLDQAMEFWSHIIEVVAQRGTLYFELAARAMNSEDLNAALRRPNVDLWVDSLETLWQRAGYDQVEARRWAHINLAVARGLLHEFLLTRDRRAVDEAMMTFATAAHLGVLARGGPGKGKDKDAGH